MADHHFFQTFKHTPSLADIEFINCFSDQDPSFLNFHNSILPQNLENLNLHGFSVNAETTAVSTPPPPPIISPSDDRKRKAMDITINTPESSSANTSACSSPQVSESGRRKTKRRGRGKKEEGEKPKEVIHVRAKRGQATDSHSLAERVRRGKINERLRCLQDIVPGCYKTMGMAVMLDEIINYVQSLQSQVDFLSMKLGAVSSFYEFNTDVDAMEAIQRENAYGALKVESVANEFSQLGQNFGYCMELAHTG